MTAICVTRHLKNVRHLQATAPNVLPREEPPDGYASRIAADVLGRLHAVARPEELLRYPDLVQALRRSPPPKPRTRAAAPLFQGTLVFVRVAIRTPRGTISMPTEDLTTAIAFSRLASVPISRYAAQYGANRINVSPIVTPFTVTLPASRYNDQALQRWVNTIASENRLSADTCIAILNPQGVVNTDADASQGVGGYHSLANVPYLFVNAMGPGFTTKDEANLYSLALSHEIAEMVVDPQANLVNPEVCDPCGPNCQTAWIDYFDPNGGYLGTSQAFPPDFAYGFFINGIVRPDSATACPAPGMACDYGPP